MYDQQTFRADTIRRLFVGRRGRAGSGSACAGGPVPLSTLFGETTVRYWRGW